MEIWVSRVLLMHDKPVVVLDPDGVFAPLREQVDLLVRRGFARPSVRDAVRWATTVDEAFDALERPTAMLPPARDEVLEAEPGVPDET